MHILRSTLVSLLLTLSSVEAWTTTSSSSAAPGQVQRTELSRQAFLQSATAALLAGATSTLSPSSANAAGENTLPNGVTYEVQKVGTGPKLEIGELAAIRFAAYSGDTKIDDIFDTPEPYYTRIGSGGLIKGAEQALTYMKLGDRWRLTVPSELAFGKQGRPSSPGKPRIPGDATIIFDLEIVGIPGKEPELIELIGDA